MKKWIAYFLLLCMFFTQLSVMAETAPKTDTKDGFTYILLAPGQYTDNGIWTTETDSATGIPFMIGGTGGKLSEDKPAKIVVNIPQEGVYKLYALSKDNTSAPGTRSFDVTVGDVRIKTGNHGNNGFCWQESEALLLFSGEIEINVIDCVGNHARNAVLVLTNDLNFAPNADKETVAELTKLQYKPENFKATSDDTDGRPDKEIAVKLNGAWLSFDVDPMLINDRTMVPFRAIFEALGCSVSWEDETQTAIGQRNGVKIELPINQKAVKVADKTVVLDQPATLVNGRTMVPLRFVSEALGAKVKWLDESQTVLILAQVPEETVLFTPSSFREAGSWVFEENADGAFNKQALKGLTPSGIGATVEDADSTSAKPAVAEFEIKEGGTYYVWCRSKDYASNQQGDRYFQLSFNDGEILPHKFGTHGKTGYYWAKGDTVTLDSGVNTLYVHDTSGFYARFDGVLLTKDEKYVPSEQYESLISTVYPCSDGVENTPAFPYYATEQNQPTESFAIENETTKVVFYKVPTSKGQVVQNEIYSKHNGAWIKTKDRSENLGYLVMRADNAIVDSVQEYFSMETEYTSDGKKLGGLTENPFDAGLGTWFVPDDYIADGNKITLYFPQNEVGNMTATWTLDDNTMPYVAVDTMFHKDGFYSVAAWEGKAFSSEEVKYVLAPFRVQYKRIPERQQLISEQYLFTPMGTYTLPENNEYSALPVTKGIAVEPSAIPQRWVYPDNNLFGIAVKSKENLCQGNVFAPVMGTDASKMTVGETFKLEYRVVSQVGDWFDTYRDISQNLFDVTDYRENYKYSLNQVIYNTRELMMDDVYGGWDKKDMAHYNMEGMNITSTANSMQAMQMYLLTENEDVLVRRAIPTLANALTRGTLHFNRVGETGGASYWEKLKEPNKIGEPIESFNANVWGGMYEMTQGSVPYLLQYATEKGEQEIKNGYGSVASFSNDINLYKYTGDKKYLDSAIQKADAYLEEIVYADSTEQPLFGSFIYISYYPSLASLIDIYEVTGDKKYLDAAAETARWMSTGLWVPGVDGEKKTNLVETNGENVLNHLHYAEETSSIFWWAGDKQFRIGRTENLKDTTAGLENITKFKQNVAGWIPSRVGLGVEQASTFTDSANIIMQCFAGDFMKLSAYTGDDYFATAARNAIIGRFRSYDGYYRDNGMTYQLEQDYPRVGPDYTGIYWHHLPPYLAMLEDFLIGQSMAWSDMKISFPSLRQQGYAYFNSNQYGHAAGTFFSEKEMWLWLDEGIVNPDNIQIDYIAAKKDGVLGIALMNESGEAIDTTLTLGEKVPIFNGVAELYDKNGKIGTVDVQNGVFSLNIPAKSLVGVVLKTDGIYAPAFSKMQYGEMSAEIGATMSHHTNGKGYVLQMTPENYFAYIYIADLPATTKELSMTYTVDGQTKTVTETVYPFEFVVQVDDADAVFTYTLSVTDVNGNVSDYGGGTLMTNAKSKQEGIVYKKPAVSISVPGLVVSDVAKKLAFEPFKLKYTVQGGDNNGFRFVVSKSDFPFEPTAEKVIGLPVNGKLIDKESEQDYNSVIIGYEDRGNGMCTIITAFAGINNNRYSSTAEDGAHRWDILVQPIN
ncbi:MAG: hypothetical protein IJE10_09735 [Clostridia bacterium]|nr:hypothetical protein [Clostridia bacterium]